MNAWTMKVSACHHLPLEEFHPQVEALTWQLPGGADAAQVRLDGALANQDDPRRWLGAEMSISPAGGTPCWWGCLHGVEVQRGGMRWRWDLAQVVNRCAVRYRAPTPWSVEGGAAQFQTPWAEDGRSQRRFGVRERVFAIGESSQDEALARRDALLAEHAAPRLQFLPALSGTKDFVLLEGRGWWHTLGWRYALCAQGWLGSARREGTSLPWGHTSSVQRLAQAFTPDGDGWDCGEIWVWLVKTGAPADSVELSLCADSGGLPGAVLSAFTLPAASLSRDPALGWVRLRPASTLHLNSGSRYWLVLKRTGALDGQNAYLARLDADGTLGTSPGLLAFNGSAWQNAGAGSLLANLFGEEALTAHLARLLGQDGAGQCLRGVFVRAPSSKRVRLYNNGTRTALEEVNALLALDNLDAFVTPQRFVVLERRSAPPAVPHLTLDADGILRQRDGSLWQLSIPPLGRWAGVRISASRSVLVRLERVAWHGGVLRVEGFTVWTGES